MSLLMPALLSQNQRHEKTQQPLEVLLQAALVTFGDATKEGRLVQEVRVPWWSIIREIERDSNFIHEFVKNPHLFEEFIAGAYEKAGCPRVTLTPRSGDLGRDVIAEWPGIGAVRFFDQAKAYSPGHLVPANDVRAMAGVLSRDQNVSKGIVTTTSDFAPGVDKEFASFVPYRLELRNGENLREWLAEVVAKAESA
jgi:restriction system protein